MPKGFKTTKIDIEPTWESIGRMVERGYTTADQLKPALKLADTIRQAQKQGKAGVVFKFRSKRSPVSVRVLPRRR